MHEDWPTASEVSKQLGLDHKEFVEMIKTGEVRGKKVSSGGRNGHWRVDPAQFPELSVGWLSTEAVAGMLGIQTHAVAALLRQKSKSLLGRKEGKTWKIDPNSPRLLDLKKQDREKQGEISSDQEDYSDWVPLKQASEISGVRPEVLLKKIAENKIVGRKVNISEKKKRWYVDPDSLDNLPQTRIYTRQPRVLTKNGFPVIPAKQAEPPVSAGELTLADDKLPEEFSRVLELVSMGARIVSFSASLDFEWSKNA